MLSTNINEAEFCDTDCLKVMRDFFSEYSISVDLLYLQKLWLHAKSNLNFKSE